MFMKLRVQAVQEFVTLIFLGEAIFRMQISSDSEKTSVIVTEVA